jgi:hypothetical protein
MLGATVWNQPPPAEQTFYSALPDVDLSSLAAERRSALLKRLTAQRCPCECVRPAAACRNRHGSCNLSLAEARAQAGAIVSAARRAAPAAPSSK